MKPSFTATSTFAAKLQILFVSALCILAGCYPIPEEETKETPRIDVISSELDYPLSGTQASATLHFSANMAWTAVSDQEWCHVSPSSGEAGTHLIQITAEDNPDYSDRTAVVILQCAELEERFAVTQKQKDAILISATRHEIGYEGGEITIEVETNVDVETIQEDGSDEWLHLIQTKSLNSSEYILSVEPNKSGARREGQIVFTNGELQETVTVYQEAKVPSIVLTRSEYVIPAEGETIVLEIKTNTDYSIYIPEARWIKEVSTKSMSTYTHYFEILPNDGYDSREAVISVYDNESDAEEKVTITQLQKDAIVVAKNEYSMPWEGGELSMEVSSNIDLDVNISVDWIEPVTTKGLEQSTLYFHINENVSSQEREGTITISGGALEQTIKVTQDCKPYINVTPKEFTVSSVGERIALTIDANVPYEITYPEGDWWIVYSPDQVYGQRIYEVLENETFEPRSSILKVYNDKYGLCEEVTVFQAQKDAIIVAQKEYNITSAQQTLTFDVQHNVDFEVSISKDWISQVETRGLNTTSLTFAVAENTSSYSRSNTITIKAGTIVQTIEVVQEEYNADREILVALYNATSGHMWEYNDNWCTDLPLDQWYGVMTDHLGRVTDLELGKGMTGTIDLSGMTKLQRLQIGDNDCTGLKLDNCPALTYLSTFGNQFTSLDLSGCPALVNVSLAGYSEYETWTGSGWELSYYENLPLKELNLTGCDYLQTLSLDFTSLTELEVSNLPSLYALYCTNNEFLTSLKLLNLHNLGELQCYGNSLEELDMEGCEWIDRLWCGDNKITSLDLSELIHLSNFNCASNQLSSLDFSNNPVLRGVVCSGNPLRELNLGVREDLELLECENCELERLEISDIYISTLQCSNSQIKELSLNNVSGDYLYCSDNAITTLDASGFRFVDCSNNRLTEIKTGQLLFDLDCHNNCLTELEFEDFITLAHLDCSYNKLKTLDVMNVKGFDMGLNCSHNELKSVAFYSALGFNSAGNQLEEITTSEYMLSLIGTEYFIFEFWGKCDPLAYLPPTHQHSYEFPRFNIL